MGKSHQDIIAAFDKGATSGRGSRIFIEGDTIYSYGYHFPLAKRIGDHEYLINPDSYSVSTSRHQSYISQGLAGVHWGAPGCDISKIVGYFQSKISEVQEKLLRSRKYVTFRADTIKSLQDAFRETCDRFDLKIPPKTSAETTAEAEIETKIKRKLLEVSLKGGI